LNFNENLESTGRHGYAFKIKINNILVHDFPGVDVNDILSVSVSLAGLMTKGRQKADLDDDSQSRSEQ
jgi:hypothetical protein